MDRVIATPVECGFVSRPFSEGETSGDACLILPLPDGAMVAVVDGLGHGPAAASAARGAIELLTQAAGDHPLEALRRCHKGLRATRGVVMSVAWFDGVRDTMTWLGVGNVEGVLQRADPEANPRSEFLLLRGGIVGRQLPALHAGLVGLMPGDMVVFATDGVDPTFTRELPDLDTPRAAAEQILARYGHDGDDALVAVVRYKGTRT